MILLYSIRAIDKSVFFCVRKYFKIEHKEDIYINSLI